MDDDPSASSGPSGTFHTPEQGLFPPPVAPRAPGTASAAAAAPLPPTAAGKKRSAEGAPEPDSPPGAGFLGRIVSSMTPSRWKRSRSSLDAYNGSAVEGANRTPRSSLGSDEASGGGGYASDGVKSSGTRLKKMNLERKFDDAPSASAGNDYLDGGSGERKMPVQQATAPEGQSQSIGGRDAGADLLAPANKRVRLSNVGVSSNGRASVSFAPARASATSPYYAFVNTQNAGATPVKKSPFAPSVSAAAPVGPKFSVGSATKPSLRDVRGRMATPGGKISSQRRHTPGASRGMRGGPLSGGLLSGSAAGGGGAARAGGLSRSPGGTVAAARNLAAAPLPGATAVRRTGAPAPAKGPTLLRTTGYRRRPIRARSFKPMSRLLTGAYAQDSKRDEEGGGSKKRKASSATLTQSIVSQIREEGRGRLGLGGEDGGELALFGGKAAKSGDRAVDEARTFDEEAAAYRAANRAVPRVRMNRVLGSGQAGGRRLPVPGGFSAAVSTPAPAANNATAASSGTALAAAAAPAPSLGHGTARPPAAAPAPKQGITFRTAPLTNDAASAAKSDAEMQDAEAPVTAKPFVPYAVAALSPRGTDPATKLTPCKPTQENVSQVVGEEIARMVASEDWRKEAMGEDLGFSSSVCTPRKSATRRRGTPHPKKVAAAAGLSTPALPKMADDVVAATGAPFSFMPGGAAASSKVDTPAFKYEKSPPSAEKIKSPGTAAKSTAEASAASGWGDLFKPKPGEWKCEFCFTKNPKDALACLACEAPRSGAKAKNDGKDSGVAKGGSDAVSGGPKGSIGAGGFSFGSSSTKDTSADSNGQKGSIGTSGFSFGAPATAAKDPGAGSNGQKGGISTSGFTFGGPAASAPAPSVSAPGGGFAFKSANPSDAPKEDGDKKSGGVTPGATPAKAKRGRGDKNEVGGNPGTDSGGFSFGGAAPSHKPDGGSVGFSFSTATPANTPAKTPGKTPAKSKHSGDGNAPGGGLGLEAAAPAPASVSKLLFSFGAGTSGDEKKEDPAGTGGFAFGAAEKEGGGGGGASVPGFTFGAPQATQKKDETTSTDPPSKKKMFTFGSGNPSLTVPAGNGDAGAPQFGAFGAAAPPTAEKTAPKPVFAFGDGAPVKATESAATSVAAAPMFGAPAFQAPAPATTTGTAPKGAPAFSFGVGAQSKPTDPPKTNEDAGAGAAPKGVPKFSFGAGAPVKPVDGGATAPAPAFGSGAPAASQAPPPAGGATFTFGSTPAPAPANPPAPSGAGFTFGAGSSTPAAPLAFGAAPAPAAPGGFGFGGGGPPAAAAPTTPGAFGFGGAPTPAAPPSGFGAAPAPAAGGFNGFSASQPAAAPTTPGSFGFGNAAPAPNPTPGFAPAATTPALAFGANTAFGGTPSAMGGAAPGGGGGAFSIGTGGPKRTAGGKTTGGRRILKARRPPGTR